MYDRRPAVGRGAVNPNPPGTDPDLAGARIAKRPVVEMAACNI